MNKSNYNYDSPIHKSYKPSASTSPSVNTYRTNSSSGPNNKLYKTTTSSSSPNNKSYKTTNSISSCNSKYLQTNLISNKDKLLKNIIKNRDDTKYSMENIEKDMYKSELNFFCDMFYKFSEAKNKYEIANTEYKKNKKECDKYITQILKKDNTI